MDVGDEKCKMNYQFLKEHVLGKLLIHHPRLNQLAANEYTKSNFMLMA